MNGNILDDFEDLSGWHAIASGQAQLHISQAQGRRAKAMRLDFDFRGGGSFSFDLFLDFLLIETTPGEPSFKSEPYSASNHSRHSQRLKRRAPDGASIVKQVLRGD